MALSFGKIRVLSQEEAIALNKRAPRARKIDPDVQELIEFLRDVALSQWIEIELESAEARTSAARKLGKAAKALSLKLSFKRHTEKTVINFMVRQRTVESTDEPSSPVEFVSDADKAPEFTDVDYDAELVANVS